MMHSDPYHCVSLRSSHGHRAFTDADEEGNKSLKCVHEPRSHLQSLERRAAIFRDCNWNGTLVHRTIVLSLHAPSGYNGLLEIMCRSRMPSLILRGRKSSTSALVYT